MIQTYLERITASDELADAAGSGRLGRYSALTVPQAEEILAICDTLRTDRPSPAAAIVSGLVSHDNTAVSNLAVKALSAGLDSRDPIVARSARRSVIRLLGDEDCPPPILHRFLNRYAFRDLDAFNDFSGALHPTGPLWRDDKRYEIAALRLANAARSEEANAGAVTKAAVIGGLQILHQAAEHSTKANNALQVVLRTVLSSRHEFDQLDARVVAGTVQAGSLDTLYTALLHINMRAQHLGGDFQGSSDRLVTVYSDVVELLASRHYDSKSLSLLLAQLSTHLPHSSDDVSREQLRRLRRIFVGCSDKLSRQLGAEVGIFGKSIIRGKEKARRFVGQLLTKTGDLPEGLSLSANIRGSI